MDYDSETTEWDAICRICLQEGDMHSIFDSLSTTNDYDFDDETPTIAKKIMLCSPIEIKQGMNMPEQICTTCLSNLDVAYSFRKCCERSDAILQSFIENDTQTECAYDRSVVVNSETGHVYKYKPPSGLRISRIKTEAVANNTSYLKNEMNSPVFIKSEPYSEPELDIEVDAETTVVERVIRPAPRKQKKPDLTEYHLVTEDDEFLDEMDDTENYAFEALEEELPIKTVKTNKARLGTNKRTFPVETGKISPVSPQKTKPRSRQSKEPKSPKKCEICGNTYRYQHALESHMRRHRNEKPFVCTICGKGFVINFELNRHMRTHTGQKPYACKHCDRRFSDFGSRVKHERTHTGERPYACNTCGKTFTYSHVLSSHNLIHTGEKKYGCEVCSKRFAKSHHLKAHMNTHNKQAANQANAHKKQAERNRMITTVSTNVGTLVTTTDTDVTDASIDQYIITTTGDVHSITENDEDGEQLLLYGDVDVLSGDSALHKIGNAQYIEDENGIQEITIEEQQDAIELLTFEDDQLE